MSSCWISVIGTLDQGVGAGRWDIEATSPPSPAAIGIRADTLKPGAEAMAGTFSR